LTENIGAETVKTRIAIWACVGFLVAGWWGLYFANADKGKPIDTLVMTFARLTQPLGAVAVAYLKSPISLPWFLVVNAATYALVGLILETLRRKLNHAD
jgi:CBS-domain-containing membrane protein